MPEFTRSIDIDASSDQTFAFVSDVSNLPRYVPTTRSAEVTSSGHVRVQGVANGDEYADDGHIFIDADRKLMRWGSGASAYRGELTVAGHGETARVAIQLHFRDGHAPDEAIIERSLDESLQRLKDQLTAG